MKKRKYGREIGRGKLIALGVAIGIAALWPLAMLAQNTQNRMGSVAVNNGGAAVYLYDSAGAASHGGATSREVVFYVTGTISGTSVTVKGCMRSATNTIPGTCDTANELTFTGTATAIQQMNGGYDYYQVSGTWAGIGTVTVLGSDTVASFSTGGGGSGCTPSGTQYGVLSNNPVGTCVTSADVLVDNGTFSLYINNGTSNQEGIVSTTTNAVAGEFNSQSATIPDIELDNGGLDLPDGSIITNTTDEGVNHNLTAQMAYNPASNFSCTVGTGVTSCAVYSSYFFATRGGLSEPPSVNYGTLKIVGGTATTGTIATLTFSLQSSERQPNQCDIIEQGSTVQHGLAMLSSDASTPPVSNITAAVSVAGATIYANYHCYE